MRRSLWNIVHLMTDQDSSLGSSITVANTTKPDEIPYTEIVVEIDPVGCVQ